MKMIAFVCLYILAVMQNGFSQGYEGPPEIRPFHKSNKHFLMCRPTDKIEGFYSKFFNIKKIVMYWKYRPNANEDWKLHMQDLTTSYWIIDTWSHGRNDLYVLGLSDSGKTIIERWRFMHQPFKWSMPAGGGSATWSIKEPTVRRKEIYYGDDLNHIMDISGDLQGRFLLLFRLEDKEVLRMDPTTGDYFTLFGPSECGNIVDFRRIVALEHSTEGYIYVFERGSGWREPGGEKTLIEKDGKIYIVSDHVVVKDTDKDGVIDLETLEYLSPQQWVDSGFMDG